MIFRHGLVVVKKVWATPIDRQYIQDDSLFEKTSAPNHIHPSSSRQSHQST
jgi:hypothetical protein